MNELFFYDGPVDDIVRVLVNGGFAVRSDLPNTHPARSLSRAELRRKIWMIDEYKLGEDWHRTSKVWVTKDD